MEGLLSGKAFPPGFRFHPTDEELFMYYLKRKVLGKRLSPEMIAEVDVYRFAPWELPPMASLKTRDLNWYFFCPRARKYPNGGRANRATVYGYWKSTGIDRTMMFNSRLVGKIKTLIFHRGKAPKGERTDWVMHEYRLEDEVLARKGVAQDSYVICKIYEKSGLGPKNGENYGARFVEEEWDSDDENNVQERCLEHHVPIAQVPDGSISALASVGCSSNVDPLVDFTTAISGLTSSGGSPNVNPLVDFPTAIAAFPDANITSPNTTTASVETPFTACVGVPNTIDVSHGTAHGTVAPGPLAEDDLNNLLSFLTEELDDGSDFFNGLDSLEDVGFPSSQVELHWSGMADNIELDDIK